MTSRWTLALVHSDSTGRMRVRSVRGFRYFSVFVDDATDYKTQILRTDGAGEMTSAEFEAELFSSSPRTFLHRTGAMRPSTLCSWKMSLGPSVSFLHPFGCYAVAHLFAGRCSQSPRTSSTWKSLESLRHLFQKSSRLRSRIILEIFAPPLRQELLIQ